MTVRTSGRRQQSIWASVVSDDATALRDWLLALGFVEDLLTAGGGAAATPPCQLDGPGGGRVMLPGAGGRLPPCRRGPSSLLVVPADPDAVLVRAHALGAPVV